MRKISLMIVSMILACAPLTVIGSQKWFEYYGRPGLVQKAAFDFSCPKEQIETVPLGGDRYTQIGARGCHKKASFVYLNSGAWALNSEIQAEKAELTSSATGTGPM